jgi:hypothetical protein
MLSDLFEAQFSLPYINKGFATTYGILIWVSFVVYSSVSLFLGTYKGVSKSFRIISVAREQMAAQGCASSYSDLQSW